MRTEECQKESEPLLALDPGPGSVAPANDEDHINQVNDRIPNKKSKSTDKPLL